MKRVFITGASSYLGVRLCRRLLADGWFVTAGLHRSPLPSDLMGHQRVATAMMDDDPASWRAALSAARADVAVHLAAQPGHAAQDVRAQLRANLETGILLLEAMREAGCRALVNTGTYWQDGDGTSPAPTCLYAAAKSAFEIFIAQEVATHGLRACTLVLYDVYGEDDPRDKLMRQLVRAAQNGIPIDLTPGAQLVDLVHVDDVVRAYGLALESLRTSCLPGHARYMLSGGRRHTLREVVRRLEHALGQPIPVRWGGRPYRPREVMRPATGPSLPGWAPRVDVDEGLARVVRAMKVPEACT